MTEKRARDGRARTALPWRSAALVAAACLASLPPAGAWLAFERAALERGGLWRLLTGHLVHPGLRLALVDLGALLLVGALLEARRPRLLAPLLVASALATSLYVLYLRPDLARYEGSSALSSGLFVALGCDLLARDAGGTRLLGLLALLAFASKIGLELAGAWPDALAAGDPREVLPGVHLLGGLCGLAAERGPALRATIREGPGIS